MAKTKGKRPQRKVDLPAGWWPRLVDFCKEARTQAGDAKVNPFDIYEFTGISRRTLSTAQTTNQLTEQMFETLSDKVGCINRDALLKLLSPPSGPSGAPHAVNENLRRPSSDLLDSVLLPRPEAGPPSVNQWEKWSQEERHTIGALLSASAPITITDLENDFLLTDSVGGIATACEGLRARGVLELHDGRYAFSSRTIEDSIAEDCARTIATEIATHRPDILRVVRLPGNSRPRSGSTGRPDMSGHVAIHLERQCGTHVDSHDRCLEVLRRLTSDVSLAATNVLNVLVRLRGHLSDITLPSCTFLAPDFRGILARNLV